MTFQFMLRVVIVSSQVKQCLHFLLQRAYGETRKEAMGPFALFWIMHKRIVFARVLESANIRWFSVTKRSVNIKVVFLWSKKSCWFLDSRENFREFPADVIFFVYADPSLSVGSYFAVSQMLGVAPRSENMHHSALSVARSIRVVGQLG